MPFGGQNLYCPGQGGVAVLFFALLQHLEDSGGAQENTGVEAIEVGQSLTDIMDLSVLHLDASDILHVDEGVAGVAVHH